LLFNAGCIEQMFSSNPEKNSAQISLVVFEINAKNAPLIPKKITPPSRRLGYFHNQLKSC